MKTMIKKKLIYVTLFTLIFLLSRPATANILPADTPMITNGISVSYWGTIADNAGYHLDIGCKLGFEKYFLQYKKFTIVGIASLLLQRRPGVYTSAGLLLGMNTRWISISGIYLEHGITFGYLGSYYHFDIYKTNSNGQIVNIGRELTNTVIGGYSAGFGYDFSMLTKINFQLFVRPNMYMRFPNNDNVAYMNNFNIECGLIFHPKFLKL
jgi:hypothetical protein